jgi:catechol 2,3-dioxygenase-like lactoylglutathione lyase family enzyme
MNRVTTILTIALVAGVLFAAETWVRGQSAAPATSPTGAVVGTGTFTGFVENMDRSLAFYRDAFGMDVPALPASGERPYNQPNPQLFDMFDIGGAKERHVSARVPRTGVSIELMEIQNVDHKVIPMRSQDPGTATLVFIVRDLDAALARAKDARATVVTPGGAPVLFADRTRAILLRDVDSRLIELRQAPGTPLAATATQGSAANLLEHRLSIAVGDLDRTMRVYREVLGFSGTSDEKFTVDPGARALTGLKGIEIRRGRVQAPGSMVTIEFVEYKGVDREPHAMRIQDRGAARLQLRAQNVDGLVESMKRAGLKVMSVGGVAVPIPPNLKGALVADPNNFFLTPFAPCDGCAPTLAPVGRGRQ